MHFCDRCNMPSFGAGSPSEACYHGRGKLWIEMPKVWSASNARFSLVG
jgi:hypothetical protein